MYFSKLLIITHPRINKNRCGQGVMGKPVMLVIGPGMMLLM